MMLGLYWVEFFKKRRRLHTGTTAEDDLKQSEDQAKEAVIRRLSRMTTYVGQIEDLIKMNPIARNKLTTEACEMMG